MGEGFDPVQERLVHMYILEELLIANGSDSQAVITGKPILQHKRTQRVGECACYDIPIFQYTYRSKHDWIATRICYRPLDGASIILGINNHVCPGQNERKQIFTY